MALDSSCVNGGRLTVSIGEELKLQKILVPTDLSKNSATAINFATSCTATRLPDLSHAPHSTGGRHLVSPPLPFSLEQVFSYFNDAFGKPAHKVSDGTFVYTDRSSSDESVRLVLSAKQQKIALTLFTRGDPGA
jgi:hypothetical protein